jgi:hypothetical protein
MGMQGSARKVAIKSLFSLINPVIAVSDDVEKNLASHLGTDSQDASGWYGTAL